MFAVCRPLQRNLNLKPLDAICRPEDFFFSGATCSEAVAIYSEVENKDYICYIFTPKASSKDLQEVEPKKEEPGTPPLYVAPEKVWIWLLQTSLFARRMAGRLGI